MGVVTKYRLAEECGRIIYGGNIPVAGKVLLPELMISVAQVANAVLKTEYFQINAKMGEMIPNGAMIGLYENIPITQWRGKSQALLPVMPLKLPRNMGIYAIFDSSDPTNQYIPLQMGEWSLLQSQPMLSNLLGQCGYEAFGMQILFTKDLTSFDPANPTTVGMRLVILDINLYGDYDPLPVLPEQEWQIKKEVCAMYGAEIVSDKIVDPGHKEQKGVPIPQQAQT